jgi:hypothetical protein
MSPKVMEVCSRQRYFKQQIIDLGLEWLEQESGLKFDKNNGKEDSRYQYRGGLGEDKDIPVLFHIDEEMLQSQAVQDNNDGKPTSKVSNKKEELLSSTKSLLAQIQKQNDSPEPILSETKLPFQQTIDSTKKKPIIQEVGVDSEPAETQKTAIEKKSVSVSLRCFFQMTGVMTLFQLF